MKSFKLCAAAALLAVSAIASAATLAPATQTGPSLNRVALNPQPLPPKAQSIGSARLVVGPPYSPPAMVGQGTSPLAQRGIIIVGGKTAIR